jgi:hypothetical protein
MKEVSEEINYSKTNGVVPKGGTALLVIAMGWWGYCTFSYEIRKYHNPWSETTCLARPLDLAPHIIYTINSNFIVLCCLNA